jgi:hypothetical protein
MARSVGKESGSGERQFVMLGQVSEYIALRDVPQARNGLYDAFARERVGMRRGLALHALIFVQR